MSEEVRSIFLTYLLLFGFVALTMSDEMFSSFSFCMFLLSHCQFQKWLSNLLDFFNPPSVYVKHVCFVNFTQWVAQQLLKLAFQLSTRLSFGSTASFSVSVSLPYYCWSKKTDVKETFVSGAILIMQNVVWYRMESGRFQIIAFLCFFFACFNLFPFPSCRRSSASLSTPSDLLQFM